MVTVRDQTNAVVPANHRRDLEQFGKAAAPFRIRLNEGHEFPIEKGLSIPPRVGVLSGRQWDSRLAMESRVRLNLLW